MKFEDLEIGQNVWYLNIFKFTSNQMNSELASYEPTGDKVEIVLAKVVNIEKEVNVYDDNGPVIVDLLKLKPYTNLSSITPYYYVRNTEFDGFVFSTREEVIKSLIEHYSKELKTKEVQQSC